MENKKRLSHNLKNKIVSQRDEVSLPAEHQLVH